MDTNSRKQLFPLKMISELTGVSVYALNRRAIKLNIKGKCTGNDSTRYYTRFQIERIVAAHPITYANHWRKIDIIEMYLRDKTGREISEIMNISVKLTYDCIREFNETGCIIVESKISRVL